LYKAFWGFVIQPSPLGARNPRAFLIIRLGEVRAAKLFFKEGLRNPNFIPAPKVFMKNYIVKLFSYSFIPV
jgi:hypothetical protein